MLYFPKIQRLMVLKSFIVAFMPCDIAGAVDPDFLIFEPKLLVAKFENLNLNQSILILDFDFI